MYNKGFKLIATAVGLVAVLVLGLAVPGVSQQTLTRENLIQLINRVYAPTLTASEGDIWDTQCADLYSNPFMTVTIVPLHPASSSLQRLVAEDDPRNVALFTFYIHEDGDTVPVVKRQLPHGSYTVKLKNSNEVVFVNHDGNEVLSGRVRITRSDKPSVPYLPCFPGHAEIGFALNVTSQTQVRPDTIMTDGKIKFRYRKCILWCLFEVEVEVEIDAVCELEDKMAYSVRNRNLRHYLD